MLMILLRITGYGWTAIVLIALSIFVAIKILKRRNPNEKSGCIGVGYVSLVMFILLSFSTMLAGMLGSFVLNVLTLPRYEAKIIDISAYQDTNRRKRTTTMYRSIVAFTTEDGTPVEIRTDISSSERREIGEVVKVGYRSGMQTAEELSAGKYILMAGGAVMLLVMGYFVIAGIFYAMGAQMSAFYRFGMNLLLYFIFPLGMLFLLGGMGYAVVLYFTGQKPDMPVWAVVVCCFFCLVLLGAMLGYLRMLRERTVRTR
jgi:hypothetical protein